jgi:hypothetical protein
LQKTQELNRSIPVRRQLFCCQAEKPESFCLARGKYAETEEKRAEYAEFFSVFYARDE